jgi:hypothetical protein
MKTGQTGYFNLNGTDLHFSINAWYNLEKQSGLTAQKWLVEFGTELQKEDRNEFTLIDLLSDLCIAAATAYSQEEETELNTNRFKLRDGLTRLNAQEIQDLANIVFRNSIAEDKLGK